MDFKQRYFGIFRDSKRLNGVLKYFKIFQKFLLEFSEFLGILENILDFSGFQQISCNFQEFLEIFKRF